MFESKIFRSRFATDCVVDGKQNMIEKIHFEMNFWIFFPENISIILIKILLKKKSKIGVQKKEKMSPEFFYPFRQERQEGLWKPIWKIVRTKTHLATSHR